MSDAKIHLCIIKRDHSEQIPTHVHFRPLTAGHDLYLH